MQRRLNSIKFKLVLLFLGIVLMVMMVSGVVVRVSIEATEAGRLSQGLSQFAITVDRDFVQTYQDPALIHQALLERLFFEQLAITVHVLDPQGHDYLGRGFSSSAVIAAMAGQTAFTPWERGQATVGEATGIVSIWASYATPVTVSDTGQHFIIYLRQDVRGVWESIENITVILVVSIFIALALAGVLAVLFASTLTKPIILLSKISRDIEQGQVITDIPVFGDDEIGQLSQNFSRMNNRLQENIQNLYLSKARTEVIIQTTADGIIAFDIVNGSLHLNKAASQMLALSPEQATYPLIIKLLQIDDLDVAESSVQLGERILLKNIAHYYSHKGTVEGIVITLHDITKQTTLENLRREFVANVSHEIRTPLTVIKSYAETLLEDEAIPIRASFLNTITTEVDRMTMLASDLLELSQFDNKQLKMDNKPCDLVQILTQAVAQARILAEAKEQSLVFHTQEQEANFVCDPLRISQVFMNIMGNALKYSPHATTVTVTATTMESCFQVQVTDQGMGIAPEDIGRIFERFFRVDKARSRDMGGTGLGLSIVKEILDIYGAEIAVASQPEQGTEVTLHFPLQMS